LTRLDRTILVVHGLLAVCFGAIGFFSVGDPDWGDLQRIVVVMMVGLWLGGLAAVATVARFVRPRVVRASLLIFGPVLAVLGFLGAARL
jgi:hypothetical protein